MDISPLDLRGRVQLAVSDRGRRLLKQNEDFSPDPDFSLGRGIGMDNRTWFRWRRLEDAQDKNRHKPQTESPFVRRSLSLDGDRVSNWTGGGYRVR